ncbi:DUF2799 domain-containing protein [uncultured Cohaesibacter sp.]|uniref:DUF2799 domain-containing protein n=1 Tax=uncultured Cohaesibacter sp. TaxID=1002546 RepID=UPI002930AB14|nr:DUF2799 domain-containing protein [uncultured Cohaesibacter sp.]
MRFSPFLLLFSVFLSGCASLSKEECVGGDWGNIGTRDAIEGHQSDRLKEHKDACERYDIIPDPNAYMQGYEKGLVTYCTPTNGFSVGRNGYEYNSICHKTSEAEFLRGYLRGRALHELETRIAELELELSRTERLITDARHEAKAPKKGKPQEKTKASERNKDLPALMRDRDQIRFELDRLRFERGQALLAADEFLLSVSSET